MRTTNAYWVLALLLFVVGRITLSTKAKLILPGGPVRLFNKMTLTIFGVSVLILCGCQDLVPRDTQSLFAPTIQRSEIVGLVAGFGTTFAALPDLIALLKRRSSVGMRPTMAAIMGLFQIGWVYYGVLIASRPVIVWNVIAILINFFTVAAYHHFDRKERTRSLQRYASFS